MNDFRLQMVIELHKKFNRKIFFYLEKDAPIDELNKLYRIVFGHDYMPMLANNPDKARTMWMKFKETIGL